MGYKSTTADFITPTPAPPPSQARGEWRDEPEVRRMKSSKSEKRIHYDLDESITLKHSYSKNQYVLECNERSSKKITDRKEEEKAQQYVPAFINKSSKNIKEEFIRPKLDKTASYHDPYPYPHD